MKKLLALSSTALLFAIGLAVAQQSVQMRPGDGGPLWFDSTNTAIFSSHITNTGKAPVLTTCGGDPAVVGTDTAGIVTVGATPTTSCVITFAVAYVVAPTCVVSWSAGPLAAMSYTISTTAITVAQTSTASNRLNYICLGSR